MKRWLVLILSLIGLSGAETRSAAEPVRKVTVIPIRQEIEPPLVYIVRRGVKEAMESHADLLVLDMKTDGGRIDVTEEIIDILNNFKGSTVTYVNDRAFSAGSFIAVATQKIYMAPESVIGAAAPIMMTPGGGVQDLPGTMEVKMNSAVRALVRRLAEKNGYNVEVVQAMIDKNREVVIDGKTINNKGDILTLTDSEAAASYGNPPHPLLSSGTVPTLDALLDKLGYAGAEVTVIKTTGAEQLGSWINAISPILLIIGILGIYIEFKTPGAILPAVVGGVAFLLYFLGGYVAGISGWGWVLVFTVGLALLISELFVHPGTILPGLAGLALIVTALIMAMVDLYPGTPALPTIAQLGPPLWRLLGAAAVSLVIMLALARILPATPVYRALVSSGASGVESVARTENELTARVGRTGVAVSNLRPSGKARFDNEVLDVITQGDMIGKGQPVKIIGHSGATTLVASAQSS